MGLEGQLEGEYGARASNLREFAECACIGAKSVNPFPWRETEPWHEALTFDSPVRKEHIVTGGQEIGLALEARLNVAGDESERTQESPINLTFRRASG